MTKFIQLPAEKKPWLNQDEPYHRTFYPMSWGKENSYALFSPGIDRFFLVDSYDPWIMLETSRVLSSKISNIVYVLDQPSIDFDNDDCLYYTTKHKVKEKCYGGPTVMSHRQNSFMIKIRQDMVVKKGWPIDFEKTDRKDALNRLKEYAAFCLRAIHALTISNNFKNPWPDRYYLQTFFEEEYPDDFIVYADSTESICGMETIIKNILYTSDSIDSALEQIDSAWRQHSKQDLSGYRQTFYFTMGLRQPPDLDALGLQGIEDKDRNEQSMWVV